MADFSERTIFIILHGEILLKRAKDTRTCLEWTRDMGYSYNQWECAARGYISDGIIQFYTGRDYRGVDQILSDWVDTLSVYHQQRYGRLPNLLHNGVAKGEWGVVWPPLHTEYLH